MRVLYAIQGTGNGHFSRAMEIVPALDKRVEVDVLVSGMHSELELNFPIKYRLNGLGFKFGKRGGVDYYNTWRQGDISNFLNEIKTLDLSSYDLVVNDFEPVSAWAARQQHIPCVGLSNQCTLLNPQIPKPRGNKYQFAKSVLKHYAPVDVSYGFHYYSLDGFIHTPIIRKEIRQLEPWNEGTYLVYLPFFNDKKIIKALTYFRGKKWIVFSKHSKKAYRHRNVDIFPIDSQLFAEELEQCSGIISGAGFSTTSEALFLGKKLLVIPMKNQYEQQCNALSLKSLGIPVIKSLKSKWRGTIDAWLKSDEPVTLYFPDETQKIVDKILSDFATQSALFYGEFQSSSVFSKIQ